MNYYSNDRDRLVGIFEDTLRLCRNDEQIKQSIEKSISNSILYVESYNPKLPRPKYADTTISVNKYQTLETAQYYKKKYPDARLCIRFCRDSRYTDQIISNLRVNPNNFMNEGNSKPLKVSEYELYEIRLRRG